MLDVHISDFWKDCAAILLIGVRNFPKQQVLYVEDIAGPDETDEFGLHSSRHLAALGAIQWLSDEGFIRYSLLNKQDSVDDFVITAKAFSRLLMTENNQPAFQSLEQAFFAQNSVWLESLVRSLLL